MSEAATIRITVNGKPATAAAGMPVPEFLRSQQVNPERVVVEHNGKAMTRAEAAAVRLAEGDCLEVVRIVAGG